jgi:hypothetical protein
VDKSDLGLAMMLVLSTKLGERAISEVWLALADAEGDGAGSLGPVVGRRKSGGERGGGLHADRGGDRGERGP